MTPTRRGLLFGLSAYLIWGLFPLYWRLLRTSGAVEVLAHRIVWSGTFVILVISVVGSWSRIRRLVTHGRTMALVVAAGTLISINWGTYIYGVNSDRVVETSLGYFINPLVTILLGVVVLHERLRIAQWIAVGVGGIAIVVLTVGYGRIPYLAMVLAISFGGYTLIKKRVSIAATDSLFLESAVLALPALGWMSWLSAHDDATFGGPAVETTVLLVLGGAVTAIPLLLFAGAANRIPLTTIGLLQYLTPTLQLAIGVWIFGEPMPPVRLVGFGLVWLALAIVTVDGIRRSRAASSGIHPQPPPLIVPTVTTGTAARR